MSIKGAVRQSRWTHNYFDTTFRHSYDKSVEYGKAQNLSPSNMKKCSVEAAELMKREAMLFREWVKNLYEIELDDMLQNDDGITLIVLLLEIKCGKFF